MEQSNGFGVASLVLSILGLVFLPLWGTGIVLSILALIFAIIQRKRHPNGIAKAGFIMAIIGIILGVITIIMFIVAFAFYSNHSEYPIGTFSFDGPFMVYDVELDPLNDTILLNVRSYDRNFNITHAEAFEDYYCSSDQHVNLPRGRSETLTLDGEDCRFEVGQWYSGTYYIQYKYSGSDEELEAQGFFNAQAI